MKYTPQIIYVKRCNALVLPNKNLDPLRMVNIGKTTLDAFGNEKRNYESKADKIKVNVWEDFDEFKDSIKTTAKFEKFAGSKVLDKVIQNWLKVTSSEWRWLDPKIYGKEIKNSSEVFIYIGLKPIDEAIRDLKAKIRKYIENPKILFKSTDKLIEHPKPLIVSHYVSNKYFELLNGIDFTSVWSETDFENLKKINSIWCELKDNDYCVVLDVDTGDLFLYMFKKNYDKTVLKSVMRNLNLSDNSRIADFTNEKVFYVKFSNIFDLTTDAAMEKIQEQINSI